MNRIEPEKLAIDILKGYEAFEAELIFDDDCWEPSGMASNPRLTDRLYAKMMTLQHFRNRALYPEKYDPLESDHLEALQRIINYKLGD